MSGKNKCLIAAVFMLGVSGVIGWQRWSCAREPSFEGRRLTAWLDEGCENFDWSGPDTEEAIRAIGNDAIPTLLDLISTRDSVCRRMLTVVRRRCDSFPVHLRDRDRAQQMGAFGFRVLGAAATQAVPALTRMLGDGDPKIRATAAYCLGVIGTDIAPLQ